MRDDLIFASASVAVAEPYDTVLASGLRAQADPFPYKLSIDGLTLRYGAVVALNNVSLSVNPGEILCLLGPSGSGKSTLLRLLAGLERPTSGRIVLDGMEVAGPGCFVEPEHRRVGMVFQDYALFPHLTVAANVAFGLRRLDRGEVQERVTRLLGIVGLQDRAASYPHMLSGGERQRVALARALAPQPQILLMDEPFSGLDGRLRDQLREQTRDILRATRTTTVMVTHDPNEALRVADRIAVLERGRLVQAGRPHDLYRRPEAHQAARAFGEVNEFVATCRQGCVETPLGRFPAPGLDEQACARVCIRPQHIRLSSTPSGVAARMRRATFLGDTTEVVLTLDQQGDPIVARVPGQAPLDHDGPVYVEVSADDVLIIPQAGDTSRTPAATK
jgi:iron(III) transport system ATP-binding protein